MRLINLHYMRLCSGGMTRVIVSQVRMTPYMELSHSPSMYKGGKIVASLNSWEEEREKAKKGCERFPVHFA